MWLKYFDQPDKKNWNIFGIRTSSFFSKRLRKEGEQKQTYFS